MASDYEVGRETMSDYLKSAESAVDDDGDHGYEISRRRFLRLEIQKVETCSILLVKRVLYIHELYY